MKMPQYLFRLASLLGLTGTLESYPPFRHLTRALLWILVLLILAALVIATLLIIFPPFM
jgi:hypothetical protein